MRKAPMNRARGGAGSWGPGDAHEATVRPLRRTDYAEVVDLFRELWPWDVLTEAELEKRVRTTEPRGAGDAPVGGRDAGRVVDTRRPGWST